MQSEMQPGPGRQRPGTITQPVIDRFETMLSMTALKSGSPPPRAEEASATIRIGEKLTVPKPGRGSPPPQAGEQQVTSRTAGIPTLPAPGLIRPGWRTEAPWGTGIRGSPRWTGPVARTHMIGTKFRGTKFRGNMKRGGRSDDTFDSGMGTLRSHGTGSAMSVMYTC